MAVCARGVAYRPQLGCVCSSLWLGAAKMRYEHRPCGRSRPYGLRAVRAMLTMATLPQTVYTVSQQICTTSLTIT